MSKYRYSKYFLIVFLLGDLISLNTGILVASFYQFNSYNYPPQYGSLHIFLNIIWILIFFSSRLQEINRQSQLLDHLNRVLSALVINLSIVFALWFALEPVDYSRKYLFITYLVFTTSIIFWRSMWHYFIRYSRTKGYNLRNVLIIGGGDLADTLVEHFNENPELGYKLVGIVDKDSKKDDISEIEKIALDRNADIIFCHLPSLSEDDVKEIIDFAENNLIKINLISQFSRLMTHNLSIEQYGNIPIINVNTIPLDHEINRIVKRVFDIIFSSLVLLFILSWLIPVIGLLIKLESSGPVFFKQKRHGKDNEDFLCWKFRTMTFQKGAKFKQATKDDSRITKIGAILRKTSIDELPQFINVFLGDMSVVGPRPHPIALNEEFQPQIDRFWQRHAVKPGITGLAQARGFRGETAELSDMSGRVKLDRFYVKNWSLTLDFKIILLTALAIAKGDQKAY
ncbi:undecaprenyl-phosphate glucose phosphotransferase [Ekhidna sp.]|uniref:undecaprenyl-phosphate glucose phosphotransferase n=1 Tax=Ekhidna sp. TaxID=2608089 RepID=UPI003516B256